MLYRCEPPPGGRCRSARRRPRGPARQRRCRRASFLLLVELSTWIRRRTLLGHAPADAAAICCHAQAAAVARERVEVWPPTGGNPRRGQPDEERGRGGRWGAA